MRKLVFDAEGLRSGLSKDWSGMRDKLAACRAEGFEVILSIPVSLVAKNDKGLDESLEELRALTALCDSVVFGGPSVGMHDLHLDDKAVNIEEFIDLSIEELRFLVEAS